MKLFHEYFEATAHALPAKKALDVDGQAVTFAELDAMADLVARTLDEAGLRVGDRVAHCAEICVDSVAIALGVLKAGCVLSTINHTATARQFGDQLRDSEARVLVTSNPVPLQALRGAGQLEMILPIGFAGTAIHRRMNSARALPLPARNASLDDVGAIFYSSGSTASPKGIVVTHRNMVAAFHSVTGYLGTTADDVVLSFTPGLSSDYGFYNILMPMMLGGTAIVRTALPATADGIVRLIAQEGVTGMQVFPPAIFLFVQARNFGHVNLRSLRYVSSSGDYLPPRYIARLRELLPNVEVFSNYGSTECKRIAYLPPAEALQRPGSVGKTIPGVQAFLVTEDGRVVTEPDTPAELAVGGELLMQHYWNKPELTQKAVRTDIVPSQRLFLTGDVFRTDADGYLYFVCRKADLFTRGGKVVNPRAVERLLLDQPGVAEAAVVPVPDPVAGHVPKACVVPEQGARLDAAALLRCCETHLQPHEVPEGLVFCDEIPRAFGGKASTHGLADGGVHGKPTLARAA